ARSRSRNCAARSRVPPPQGRRRPPASNESRPPCLRRAGRRAYPTLSRECPLGCPPRSAQAEEGQDGHDHDDEADEIDETVHEFVLANLSARDRASRTPNGW